jgi:ketosteroid isomerase-like protein
MSQENVEIVRRIYEEVSAHTWEPPRDLYDPDYTVDLSDAGPDLGVIHGVEASEAALREYVETFDAFRIEITEVIHADDRQVVVAVRDGGRLKASGAELWERFFHVWTFRNRKIVRRSSHRGRGRALEAAGLSE